MVPNPETWQRTAADGWGRGMGIGEVVALHDGTDGDGYAEVRWPCGVCIEPLQGLWRVDEHQSPIPMTPAFAARAFARGAVLAYPTEGVWGLGCDPDNGEAVRRLLAIKARPPGKGVILIAAGLEQLEPYVDLEALPQLRRAEVEASWPGPFTWVIPARPGVPYWIRGDHAGVAVRVSAHPAVIALCRAFSGALVSTSANFSGSEPAYVRQALDGRLLMAIDGLCEGETGGRTAPSQIRDAISGAVLRR